MSACVLRLSESRYALLAGRYREARHLTSLLERAVTPAGRSGRLARRERAHRSETALSRADRTSAPLPVRTGEVSRSTYDAAR